ncbi:hypothetical protein J3R30DRAFT_1364502 [Lentinula aciculospora]|uniref:Uncharacterized protein n=1 Tax=Lentinula aciculospora TaxID=153920 RepID=A0A9W9ALW1_9AGAR|nr:hypothetical protein J3R30DRAFT_1364502 [Lentinula aciculospora]
MQFHHDAHQLNIRRHASDPPHSLQASLGRELEKYDQLCDAIETYLVRAISVLQRDLKKEQQRIRDEEKAAAEAAAAAAKAEAEAAMNAQTIISMSPQITPLEAINPTSGTPTPLASTNHSPVTNAIVGGRRPSAISISSLNRPAFPLKLDLSSQSLRMSADDVVSFLPNGLRSPVTLAPKSARPMDYDIMAAFNDPRVDIDLTLPQAGPSNGMDLDLDSALGSSADKPIDLDLDGMDLDQAMSDLFGDSSEAGNTDTNADVGGLFSPSLGTAGDSEGSVNKVDANFLSSIGVGGVDGDDANADIFASFGVADGGESTSHPESMLLPATETSTAPSPDSLLASLSQASTNIPPTHALPIDESFDLVNLGNLEFLSTENDMNLESLSWMNTAEGSGGVADGKPP